MTHREPTSDPAFRILRLSPTHVADYRSVMLETYDHDTEAFKSTVAERGPLPLEWWLPRVSDEPGAAEMVFGAFVGDRLVGVAGLRFEQRPRTRHKASLFGMSVLPEHRHQGIARALVEKVLDQARSRPETRVVQLTVTESNTPAVRLYEACGFRPYGSEPFGIKVGEDRYLPLLHMWCPLERTLSIEGVSSPVSGSR